ncbi:MAG: cytochrome c3 family protein [Gemmataceae bacterium]|nr:cytochrome c3 family protein [Gemmataceae bacterium]
MAVPFWTCSLLLVAALVLALQLARVWNMARGVAAALLVTGILAGSWWLLGQAAPPDAGPEDWSQVAAVPSASCAKCHADHYESWHRSYHRTMTRDAAPDTVKGDFNNVVHDYQGLKTRFTREQDAYFLETIDPRWALMRAKLGPESDKLPPQQHVKLRVDRLVGSHWIQECMHREPSGRYQRLPLIYHIVEKRWVHSNGGFLAPDSDDFWSQCRGYAWNDSCLYCHNTGPAKNPLRGPRGQIIGYRTEVDELGISCQACHGPGSEHVRLNHNPARRLALQQSGAGDPSIVHPMRLSVPRRDEICARCHGALTPKAEAWDPHTNRDPFIPGQELAKFNHFFWSEAEQAKLTGVRLPKEEPEPIDGRFWGDGTPLTTALEYNGMALSACYEKGHGKLSCLSCHTMHGPDPNFMLKPKMNTNEACFQCHGEYRERLSAHTRHPAESAGSLCYNCHMPHLVYSLLSTHRSHRIEIPDIETTRATGKPHACNQCHLDKSLGWTQEQLKQWPGSKAKKAVPLTQDESTLSSALLLMTTKDARSRVMVAGAFANPAAQHASGVDWFGPFLTRLLRDERYPAVRYLAHRGLRVAFGDEASGPFDYLGTPAQKQAQLSALQKRFDATPLRGPLPHLPLNAQGLPDDAVLRRLLGKRYDPDLSIHE